MRIEGCCTWKASKWIYAQLCVESSELGMLAKMFCFNLFKVSMNGCISATGSFLISILRNFSPSERAPSSCIDTRFIIICTSCSWLRPRKPFTKFPWKYISDLLANEFCGFFFFSGVVNWESLLSPRDSLFLGVLLNTMLFLEGLFTGVRSLELKL